MKAKFLVAVFILSILFVPADKSYACGPTHYYPCTPSLSSPGNHATCQSESGATLCWSGCSTNYYEVYFGTSSSPPLYDDYHTSTSKSIPDSDLQPDTKYYWKIVAYRYCSTCDNYHSRTSAIWDFTTSPPPPVAPTNLTATAISSSQINLSWTDNADNESGFKIERSKDDNSSFTEIDTVGAAVGTGSVVSYSDDMGLVAFTTYYYRVRAYNICGGNSLYSNEAWATTDVDPPTPDPMEWAIQPYVSGTSSITMVVAEASDQGGGIEYYFECTNGGGHDSGWQTSRVYTDINLSNNTTYEYKVKARDSVGNETQLSTPASAAINIDYSTPQGVSEPVAGGLGNDLANFSVNPYTGNASYTIPIIIPPARGGSTPGISLGHGGGGNGWCGVGWSLGVGAIQRDTRHGVPVKLDGEDFSDEYDDDKGFVASFRGVNSRLVHVGSDIYRAEVDQVFLKFELDRSNKQWIVTDKSGNRFYFGQTSGAHMVHPDFSSTGIRKIFLWALEKIEDINGNLTWITYNNNGGQLYLQKIYYNGNSNDSQLDDRSEATHTVEFALEDRDDKSFSYKTGFRVETNKRLKDITVKVEGNYVRRYHLEYNISSSTLRSLLTSVTMYGSDNVTSLPPLTFEYQQKPFEFDYAIDWENLLVTQVSVSPYAGDNDSDTYVTMLDINGDGLPDRVSRDMSSWPDNPVFNVEINNGTSFQPEVITWGPLDSEVMGWNEPRDTSDDPGYSADVDVDTFDINGDRLPDRVMRKRYSPWDVFEVQINNGTGFEQRSDWGPLESESSYIAWYRSYSVETEGSEYDDVKTTMLDINGDGLPDRVMRKLNYPWDVFKVQLNTGDGFEQMINWGNVQGQGSSYNAWYSPSADEDSDTMVTMLDINGDGLPDHVMRKRIAPRTVFVVQFNTGFGFADEEEWGPLDYPSWSYWAYTRVSGQRSDGDDIGDTCVDFFDINGDGLPDRVMRGGWGGDQDYARFKVQLNTGVGLEEDQSGEPVTRDWTINWDVSDEWKKNYKGWNRSHAVDKISGWTYTFSTMLDIDGDGLPDRVFRDWDGEYDVFKVQLNKGPFPDLLQKVTGSLGGSVEITYESSTHHTKHQDNGGINRLPFPVYVVSEVTVNDGFVDKGTTIYDYSRGMFDPETREFRGFGRVEITDPLGTKTIRYYHQGGGYEDNPNGEFSDEDSVAKKGMSYRTEIWGSDGLLYKVEINKVEEVEVESGKSWYFPFVSKTITMDYEGAVDATGNYRAYAKEFEYDTATGNIVKEIDWAEVESVDVASHTFTTNTDEADDVYAHITYKEFTGNPAIVNKVERTKVTDKSNPDDPGAEKFKEAVFEYDQNCGYSEDRGNVTTEYHWLDKEDGQVVDRYTSSTYVYDIYGNRRVATDEVGITTTIEYDTDYETFPVRMVEGTGTINPATYKFTDETGKFITESTYNPGSGRIESATDAMGIKTEYDYDKLHRLIDVYKSTEPIGTAHLWLTNIEYNLGGIVSGYSQNFIHQRFNSYEAYIYNDGLGRIVQTRIKAETGAAGEYRVANTSYNERGDISLETLPFFRDGYTFTKESSRPGILTEYDEIGRVWKVTPPAGDEGSPTGPTITSYKYGDNLWVNVIEDAEGNKKRQYFDARGNVIKLVEETGGGDYQTLFGYDRLGRSITITDHADNVITYEYDSLDRKISVDDPDMGYWTYKYNDAGQLVKQTDAKGQIIAFSYSDEIGRLGEKKTYGSDEDYPDNPATTVTYTYDTSDNPDYTVYKGLLYMMQDENDWRKNSYDSRGRVVKTTRYLSVNGQSYTTETTYDDADRIKELTYPGGVAIVRYSYDSASHLTTVESVFGTGTPETFYQAQGFNALEQLEGTDYGNEVKTSYEFYTNSKRRKRIHTFLGDPVTGTQLQDLSYTFDKVANILSIIDSAFTTGDASSTFSDIDYDDLYRLTSLTYVVQGTTGFSYDALGNVTYNGESGGSNYVYGSSKPHAVTSAYGKSYGYDACGNMASRGSQALTYDEENQLVSVVDGSTTVTFGYDESSRRLWKKNNGSVTNIWIGDIYEEKDGKTLCHVLTDDGLVSTFEPEPDVDSVFYYYHNDHLGSSSVMTDRDGNLVKHYGYRAYGDERYNGFPANFDVSNRFTGQILDDDTGLYYYGARYYDPGLARFIQADPIIPDDVTQNSQALNRYSYCFNNPLKFTDPSGNDPEETEEAKPKVVTTTTQTEVSKNKNPIGENSSFDGGGSAVQGSKSSFYGQSSTSVETGGNGNISGSKTDNSSRQFRYDSNLDFKTELVDYAHDVGQSMIGIGEGIADVGKGLYNTARHPIKSTKALGSAVAHPVETGRALVGGAIQKSKTLIGDDPRAAGRVIGHAAGEAAVAVTVVKGIGKLSKKLTTKVEIKTRTTLGADGAKSQIIKTKSRITGKTKKVIHRVTRDGKTIHKHQKFP